MATVVNYERTLFMLQITDAGDDNFYYYLIIIYLITVLCFM